MLFAAIGLLYGCLGASSAWATLPDGRVYELVSPVKKDGGEAGAFKGTPGYALSEWLSEGSASEGEGAIVYESLGSFGETESGTQLMAIARRSPLEWSNAGALPHVISNPGLNDPESLLTSSSLSRLFSIDGGTLAPGGEHIPIFLTGEAVKPTWLLAEQPLENPDPPVAEAEVLAHMGIAGGSESLDTLYFTYYGTLLAQDAPREKVLAEQGGANSFSLKEGGGDWGLYEWHDGVLSAAGVLPNGTVDPYGAVPAATRRERPRADLVNNQVSSDGHEIFFISPDPETLNRLKIKGVSPELYVRETDEHGNQSTSLVSASRLPGHVGEAASDGPLPFALLLAHGEAGLTAGATPYVYVSPDGSHAFFVSADQLTADAPADINPKMYEYDVANKSLKYLPGVTDGKGGIASVVNSSSDGSRFLFARTEVSEHPESLGVWSEAPGEKGHTTTLSTLLLPESSRRANGFGMFSLYPTRATANGSVFVFQSDSPIEHNPSFNDLGGFMQIYRFEVETGELSCISCPPKGTAPTGDAYLSSEDNNIQNKIGQLRDSNGISADGSEVFFDTPEALVPQDVNERRDAYEWEQDEGLHLISSGISNADSYFLDNSPTGRDVYFATTSSLVPEDTDGGYDVYDARVGGGFPAKAPSAEACGEECQGPPSTPPVLSPPLSSLGTVLLSAPQPSAKPMIKRVKSKSHSKKRRRKARRKPRGNEGRKARSGPKRIGRRR
jgi:hypothetical protein